MSKYNYFSVHDLKDLASIYNDCDDYKVTIFDPDTQKSGTIYFTGSSNDTKEIYFNVKFNEESNKNVFDAFKETLNEIVTSRFNMGEDWEHRFMELVINLRK